MNTKFCIKCGNEIPRDSVFCPKCGTEVKTDLPKDETKSKEEESKYSNKQCIYCYQKIPKGLKYCPNCHPKTINNGVKKDEKISKNSNFFSNLFCKINTSISKYSKNIDQKVKGKNLNKIDKTFIVAASSGIGVALLGGYIWSLISLGTGYEIGYMATGLGILCGLAVYLSSGRRKGTPFLQIALVSSLFGIVMGKFFMAHHYLYGKLIESYGTDVISQMSTYSWTYIKYTFLAIPDIMSGYDVLWGTFACFAVIKIFWENEGD